MWDQVLNRSGLRSEDPALEEKVHTRMAQRLRKGLDGVQRAMTHGVDHDIHEVWEIVLNFRPTTHTRTHTPCSHTTHLIP